MFSFVRKNLKPSLLALACTVLVVSQADFDPNDPPAADPTYLASFGYRLSDVGGKDAVDALYATLRDDLYTNPNNLCYERAQVWAYQMQQTANVQAGKVFLFYGAGQGGSWNFNGKGWWFHVAPYVVSEGKEIVMEKFFDVRTPLEMKEWLKAQSGGKECAELLGVETDLLSWIPKNYSMPARPGAPCYYRKVPGGVRHPIEVYNHDVKDTVSAQSVLSNSAYSSCYYSISASSKKDRRNKCSTFLQDPNRVF